MLHLDPSRILSLILHLPCCSLTRPQVTQATLKLLTLQTA